MPKQPVEAYSPIYFVHHQARRDQWVKSIDEVAAFYMVGRIKAFFDFCKMKWPDKKPRVRIGEFGPDDMPDSSQTPVFEQWLKAQPSSNGLVRYPRGWRACSEVWKQFFPGEEPEQVNFDQGRAAWERVLEPLGAWAACWYIFGNGGEGDPSPARNWDDHNYAKNKRAQEIFMNTSVGSVPMPPPKPEPSARKYEPGEYVNEDSTYKIRVKPDGESIGRLLLNDTVKVLDDEPVTAGQYTWMRVEVRPGLSGAFAGWVADEVKLTKRTPPAKRWLDTLEPEVKAYIEWMLASPLKTDAAVKAISVMAAKLDKLSA